MFKYYDCMICEFLNSLVVEMLYAVGRMFEFLPIIITQYLNNFINNSKKKISTC